jgi:uncharacterized membrane protein YjjB (DUF3815 family)
MEWYHFFEKGLWFGLAALGFAILFNVPIRTLLIIFFLGAAGGLTKTFILQYDISVILATLGGATVIGTLSIFAAFNKHATPMVFAIPSVIPMVPGVFAYKAMLGVIKLAGNSQSNDYLTTLTDTANNGLKALFILLALAAGVAIPMLLTRKETIKEL